MRPVDARWPISLGYRVKARFDPTYIHRGVDYACPIGTKVGASAAGTVVYAGQGGGYGPAYGIHVVLRSEDAWVIYAHLSREIVAVGQNVAAGQQLGLSGATGNVRGAHLHYQECTQPPSAYRSDRKPKLLNAKPLSIYAASGTRLVATDLLNARSTPVTGTVKAQLRRGASITVDAYATVDGKRWERDAKSRLWLRADFLASPTTPAPKPQPDDTIVERTWNLGGYNAHGQKTWRKRAAAIAKEMLAADVDVWYVQELSAKAAAPMRQALDAAVGAKYVRTKGTDGRYCYLRRTRFALHESGAVVAAKTSWFQRDDKQGSWFRASDRRDASREHTGLSMHLENEDATGRSQVAQARSMFGQYRTKTPGARNRTVGEDANSENLVRRELESLGLITAGGATAGATALGWDGRGRTRIDYLHHDAMAKPTGYRTGGATSQTDHRWVESRRSIR